jgi:hypothetical protein
MPRRSGLIASLVIVVVLIVLSWWLWPVAEAPTQSQEQPPPAAILRAPIAADSEPEMPIEGSIAGTVRIEGERGNAVVCAWSLADDERVRDPLASHCTLTEMDGHYQLGGLEGRRMLEKAIKALAWRNTFRAPGVTARTDANGCSCASTNNAAVST